MSCRIADALYQVICDPDFEIQQDTQRALDNVPPTPADARESAADVGRWKPTPEGYRAAIDLWASLAKGSVGPDELAFVRKVARAVVEADKEKEGARPTALAESLGLGAKPKAAQVKAAVLTWLADRFLEAEFDDHEAQDFGRMDRFLANVETGAAADSALRASCRDALQVEFQIFGKKKFSDDFNFAWKAALSEFVGDKKLLSRKS